MNKPTKARQDPFHLAEEDSSQATGAEIVTKKQKPIMGEIGGTGTQDNFGIISDDYNSKFHTGAAAKIFDEMKRSDPMIRATMEALRRPILSAGYVINPASEDAKDQEISKFVARALDDMETPLCQLLEDILDYPFVGFKYFEKVFAIKDGKITWAKWASRQNSAHYRWEMSNSEKGVQQLLPNSRDNKTFADIPMEKLVLFVYQKEGSNYDGFPLLRTVYRNWEAKDILYRIQLISMERAAGVVHIKLPAGATAQDKDDAVELGENFRTNETTFLVTTQGWEVEILTAGMEGKMDRIEPEIEHHNRMIALNILAQFITLSSGDGGSNALSRDQSSFFTLGLRAIANQVAYVINQAIKELVIYNWGEQEKYPELHFNQIGQVDYSELASALSTLAGAGLIEITPEVKQTMHKTYNLPEFDIEKMKEEAEEKPEEEEPLEEPEAEDVEGEGGGGEELTPEQQQEADDMMAGLDELEGMLSEVYKLARAPMTEETKKKISEALKKEGGAEEEDQRIVNFTKRMDEVKAGITSIRDEIKAMREGSKGMDKGTKAKIKEQITAMREKVKLMMSTKKAVSNQISTRKAVLRLQKATAKASEKMQKLKAKQTEIAEKRKEIEGKIKFEKDKDKQAKLRERLAEMDVDAEENVTAQDELDVIVKKLLRTQKEVGLSEEQEHHLMVQLGEDCEHSKKLAEFKPFRALTLAESRVKFASVNDYFNKSEERIVSLLADFAKTQKADIVKAVTRAVEDGDIRGLKELAWKRSESLKKDLRKESVNALEFGKSQAAGEVGVSAPSTPNINTQILDTEVDQLVEERNVKLMGDVKAVTLAGIAAGAGLATIIFNVTGAIDSVSDTYNKGISGYIAGASMNAGRNLVFWENGNLIHGIQRSEILDDSTCAMCMSLDGRVMDVNDPFANLGEVHTNCRGLNVAILKNDSDLPNVTGMPSSITNKFDTVEGVPVTNSFTPIKTPIYTKGSRLQQKIDDGTLEV